MLVIIFYLRYYEARKNSRYAQKLKNYSLYDFSKKKFICSMQKGE